VLQKFVEFARTLPAPFPIKLQLSLQTPFEQERQELIPTARKPLAQTIKVLDEYTAVSGQPVKYNIVLLTSKDGNYTNATPTHAKAVARLLLAPSRLDGTLVSHILKLSVYNPFPGAAFVPVSKATTQKYIETLRENGVMAIKTFKGSGIAIDEKKNTGGFSCGQLAVTTRSILAATTHPALALCTDVTRAKAEENN
jgi:adenine C2-methylase RlmN of 23S rRNA A2503 and tRNA A37